MELIEQVINRQNMMRALNQVRGNIGGKRQGMEYPETETQNHYPKNHTGYL
jgi:hypothetical protein